MKTSRSALGFLAVALFTMTIFSKFFLSALPPLPSTHYHQTIQLPLSTSSEIIRYRQSVYDRELDSPRRIEDVTILIPYYGLWMGIDEEHHVIPNYLGHNVTNHCKLPCHFITDKNRWHEADAIFFEYFSPHFERDWRQKPLKFPQKLPHQKWVTISYETDVYFPGQVYLNELMDIEMNFNQTSDVPISFLCSWGGGDLMDLLKPPPPKPKNYAPVVWIAGNCLAGGAQQRYEYVKELMKHIKVDSYGECLHNKNLPKDFQVPIYDDHGTSMRNKITIFKNYKFVLSFENNNLTDYVTEKIMNAFQAGSIPVYMGAPNIEDWIPGSQSIIRTDQFRNPADLAAYLNKLDSDDGLYNSYFLWKKAGFSPAFVEKYSRCVFYNGRCRLCEKVARKSPMISEFPAEQLSSWNHVQSGYALSFNGKGYVDLGNSKAWDLDGEFTISAWIYPTSMVDYRIVDKNPAGEANGYEFDVMVIEQKGYLRLCTIECFYGVKPILVKNWSFVAVTLNIRATKGTFFINGEIDNHFTLEGWEYPAFNDIPLLIGSSKDPTTGWHGKLDEVSIWNRTLAAAEVKKMMFHRLLGNETGLLGYYLFDEGSGSVVHDSSQWARHGKLTNGQWYSINEKPYYINDHLREEHTKDY